MAVAAHEEDRDELLIVQMRRPPPLEQARSSLEYWTRRRSTLPVYRLAARREAEEMIRRCRQRVAEAECLRYGTGLAGFVRRMLAGDAPSWAVLRTALVALAWALVPRRLIVAVTAVAIVWLLVGVLVLVGLVELLT